MSPKELVDAVRQRYPNATKKEVARAAFMIVIHSAEHDPKYTQELHDLAMETLFDDAIHTWRPGKFKNEARFRLRIGVARSRSVGRWRPMMLGEDGVLEMRAN